MSKPSTAEELRLLRERVDVLEGLLRELLARPQPVQVVPLPYQQPSPALQPVAPWPFSPWCQPTLTPAPQPTRYAEITC